MDTPEALKCGQLSTEAVFKQSPQGSQSAQFLPVCPESFILKPHWIPLQLGLSVNLGTPATPSTLQPGKGGSLGLGWAVSLTHFSLICLCTSLLTKPNLQLSPRAPVTSLSNSYLLCNVLAIISRYLHLIALIRSSDFWVHIFWSPPTHTLMIGLKEQTHHSFHKFYQAYSCSVTRTRWINKPIDSGHICLWNFLLFY